MNKELLTRILSSFILIPFLFFFIIKGSIFFNFLVLIMTLITLYEWHNLSFKKIYYFPGLIFILFSFYTFFSLRNYNELSFFLLILIICISTDIGGYIFGKTLKGPKLTKISPNKTYAGMLGGFLLSLLIAILYLNNLNFLLLEPFNIININTIGLILSISLISQVGDLIISFFKRKKKIKNTGKIIPGHGGILDRIDGMIFAFPYAYLLVEFF